MSALLAWGAEALIASALLMLVVLAIRGHVRRAFGAQVAYVLWALPALRLLLPPLPADWREQVATPIGRAGEAVTVLIVPADASAATSATVAATASPLPWGAMIATAWALGALAFFALHLLRHRRFCGRVLSGARLVDEVDGVRVVESAAASGPLAFGVARRFVAFPHDFADLYDADERALALAHELGHHARRDLLANWAALAVLALHWFNPLAWRAFHAFRCDQELANDARVLAGRSRTDRHIYACAIVKAAHGGAVSAACHLHTIADLKGRLRMLTTSPASRRRLFAGAASVIALMLTGLGLTASGSAAHAVKDRVDDALAQAAPVPPAPPTPPAPAAEHGVRKTRVVVVRDGKTTRYEGAAADAYIAANPVPMPPVPPRPPVPGAAPLAPLAPVAPVVPIVSEAECAGDGPEQDRQLVLHGEQEGRPTMTICTNRIRKVAAEGARIAANSRDIQRRAILSARDGLRTARISIERERNLTEEQRAEALAGLDQARAGLDADAARAD